ncbi:hypothetical protein DFH06DRAFT_1341863 [Mycena polygramma]|nr:hypothetical protein DFH06DRAFT_1341863 [Mycena polygramma]
MVLLLAAVGALLLAIVPVESLVASPAWNTSLTISIAERVRLTGAALDVAIDRLGGDAQFQGEPYGVTGTLYSQMAQFDLITNQTKYQSALLRYFQLQDSLNKNFSDPSVSLFNSLKALTSPLNILDWLAPQSQNALAYGHAAVKAYTAYRNPLFLQYAVESWWLGRRRTISPTDLSAGKISGKNFTLTSLCQGARMVGGTFWDDETGQPYVAAAATGYFLVVSALLAEATTDPMYLQAATDSANFIHSHLYNAQGIVQEFITASKSDFNHTSACQVADVHAPTSRGSGLMIEGLSILSSITKNASTQQLLSDLLVAAVPNPAWQGVNGIVSEPGDEGVANAGDMNLLQGLGVAYTRGVINDTLRRYVGDYIAVQFNVVTSFATSNDTNIYSSTWTGPASANFSGGNQTTAIAGLISAIGLPSTSSESTSSSSASPTTSQSPIITTQQPSPAQLGPILGGTLGGLTLLLSILMVLWSSRRRQPEPRAEKFASPASTPDSFRAATIIPFTAHTSLSLPRKTKFDYRASPRTSPAPTSVTNDSEAEPSAHARPAPDGLLGTVHMDDSSASIVFTEQLVRIWNQRIRTPDWVEEREAASTAAQGE